MTAALPTVQARRALRDALFPLVPDPGGPAGRSAGRETWSALAAWWCLAAAVSFGRLSARARETVWAEDGAVFVSQQADLGLLEALLTPYNGYLHLVPRTAAGAAAVFPMEWAETVLAVVAAAVVATTSVAVLVLARGHLRGVGPRVLLAGSVVLLPVGSLEAAGNVANSHWYLMFGAFWACASCPRRWPGVALSVLLVVLALGSDPLAAILAPLVLMRVLLLPRGRDHLVTLAFLLTLAVQLVAVLQTQRVAGSPSTPDALGRAYLVRVPLTYLAGPDLAEDLAAGGGLGVGLVALALVLGAAAVTVLGPARLRWLAAAAVLSGAAFFLIPTFLTWVPQLDPRLSPLESALASRYSIVPHLLLAVVLASALEALGPRLGRVSTVAVAVVVVVGLAVQVAPTYRTDRLGRSTAPVWDAEVEQARQQCRGRPPATLVEVDPAPTGFTTTLVPCSAL